MRRRRVLLRHFAAAAQEDARVGALGRAQRGEELRFSATDVSMAVGVARQGLVRARVVALVVALVGQVGADVGVPLVRAVGAVRVRAVHAAAVHAGRDVVSVLPLAPGAGAAAKLAAFSPSAAFQARVQLDPRAVTFWVGVQQDVRRRRR